MELGTFRSVTLMLEKQVIDSCQWPGTKQKHMSQEVDAHHTSKCNKSKKLFNHGPH